MLVHVSLLRHATTLVVGGNVVVLLRVGHVVGVHGMLVAMLLVLLVRLLLMVVVLMVVVILLWVRRGLPPARPSSSPNSRTTSHVHTRHAAMPSL